MCAKPVNLKNSLPSSALNRQSGRDHDQDDGQDGHSFSSDFKNHFRIQCNVNSDNSNNRFSDIESSYCGVTSPEGQHLHHHHQHEKNRDKNHHLETIGDQIKTKEDDNDKERNETQKRSENSINRNSVEQQIRSDDEVHSFSLPSNPLPCLPYNWQLGMQNIKDRLAALYNNETLSDIVFIVGKVRLPAHKFVLSIGSPVFYAMFNGPLKRTSGSLTDERHLTDEEPEAFAALLLFLYTDRVQIGHETVMPILYTAKKYAVPALERACVDFLKKNLTPDNAFMLFSQARRYFENELADLCLMTIDIRPTDALDSDGFLEVDEDTLCTVLERNSLRVREINLFQAVLKWASAECARREIADTIENRRTLLERALQLIRFPLMSVEEFATQVVKSGMLTDKQVVQLFMYFTVRPKPQVEFSDELRCRFPGKEQVVRRFSKAELPWGYSGTSDRVRFAVNRKIYVTGFGLYGAIKGPAEYKCQIQLMQQPSGKVVGNRESQLVCDGSPKTFRVMFSVPVEVLPETQYTASSLLKGPDSYYGTSGVGKKTINLDHSGDITFNFYYSSGCNNGTSVEDGQIPEIFFYPD